VSNNKLPSNNKQFQTIPNNSKQFQTNNKPVPQVWSLPAPTGSTAGAGADIPFCSVQPAFARAVSSVRAAVTVQLRQPHLLRSGQCLTGPTAARLLPTIADALRRRGQEVVDPSALIVSANQAQVQAHSFYY
jgi:hypothetical protein